MNRVPHCFFFAIAWLACTFKLQAESQSLASKVDTSIGGISHMCVPTFQLVQRPNEALRFMVDRYNGLNECYINSLPLCVPIHRNGFLFAIMPWQGKEISPIGNHFYDCDKATVADNSIFLEASNAEIKFACANKGAIFDFNFEGDTSVKKGITLQSRNGVISGGGKSC